MSLIYKSYENPLTGYVSKRWLSANHSNYARTHSEDQVAQLAASVTEFGFTIPIQTDGDKGVISVHSHLAATRKLSAFKNAQ